MKKVGPCKNFSIKFPDVWMKAGPEMLFVCTLKM